MAWEITRFGNITLPRAMPTETMTPLPARTRIVATAAGIFDADGAQRSAPAYPLSLIYSAIVTPSAGLKAEVDALRAAVGTRARLYRTGSDASIQWCMARLIDMPHERSVPMLRWLQISLEFMQLSVWNGVNHADWELDDGTLLDDAEAFDSGDYQQVINSVAMYQTVVNNGNAPVRDVVLTVTAGTAGALSNIVLWGPGQHLKYSGNLLARSTLVIDCAAHSVKVDGADAYASFSLGSYHTMDDWCLLQPGNNAMSLQSTGTVTGASWSIEFKDAWA